MSDREAQLVMSDGASGQVLTAHVPFDHFSAEDFQKVTQEAYSIISKLHHCNCLSGRVRFVVGELYSDVINVEL